MVVRLPQGTEWVVNAYRAIIAFAGYQYPVTTIRAQLIALTR